MEWVLNSEENILFMMSGVIRMPRHAGIMPRWTWSKLQRRQEPKARITSEGIFIEELERNPARFLPAKAPELDKPVEVDLDRPMNEVLAQLTKYPVKTRLNLKGTL